MRVGSLFTGVGGFDLGFENAGMNVVFQAEVDPWRRHVLNHHWPNVPLWDDVRNVGPFAPKVDLICGGFPCQDLSHAGKRKGLAGARSGLFFEALRIVEQHQPQWVVLENVPGLLSSNGGEDFRVVVGSLTEIGYGVSWRVLDSRYFGVPQRRRRVFIVGYLGAPCPAEVLLEPEGCGWDLAQSDRTQAQPPVEAEGGAGEAGELRTANTLLSPGKGGRTYDASSPNFVIARTITSRGFRLDADTDTFVVSALTSSKGGPDDNAAQAGHLVVADTVATLQASGNGGRGYRVDAEAAAGGHLILSTPDVAATLTKGAAVSPGVNPPGRRKEDDHNLVAVAFHENQRAEINVSDTAYQLSRAGGKPGQGYPAIYTFYTTGGAQESFAREDGFSPALTRGSNSPGGPVSVASDEIGVRRLTPVECQRLQGFPDRWFEIPKVKGFKVSDSKVYAAMGDAVTVNVIEWIGRNIMAVEQGALRAAA